MPAIRGVYYTNPNTAEAGLWVMLPNGNVMGRTDAQIAAFAGQGGNTATKIARLQAALQAYLQQQLESRRPSSEWSAEDWAWIVAHPEPFCRIENGNEYVCQDSVVSIEVFSLSPVRYQITISEGASRAQVAYGQAE